MTINYGLIVDIVFGAIIALSIGLCAKKGLFECISGVAGTIAGIIGARMLSDRLAGVFSGFIRPMFHRAFSGAKVQQALSDLAQRVSSGITDMQSGLQQSLQESGLGEQTAELVSGVMDYINASASQLVQMESNGTLAARLADGAAEAVGPVIAFILLFSAIKLLVSLICRLLSANIPLIREINALGGGVMGLLSGVLTVALVCWGIVLFAPAESLGFFSVNTLYMSYIGRFFAILFG
jgi:hypothetical protein